MRRVRALGDRSFGVENTEVVLFGKRLLLIVVTALSQSVSSVWAVSATVANRQDETIDSVRYGTGLNWTDGTICAADRYTGTFWHGCQRNTCAQTDQSIRERKVL